MSMTGMRSYDRLKDGAKERQKVAGEQYDVAAFARKHGITQDQARAIIARSAIREQADEAARCWKRR
jgi:hypothetical protein